MSHKETILYSLKMIDNLVRKLMDRHITADKQGLTIMHTWIVGFLYNNPDRAVYQRDIEREFRINRATVSGMISLMEQKGLIRRLSVSHDARLKKLELTQTKRGNRWAWVKIPGHERNEALDCRNYALGGFRILNPDMEAVERRLRNMPENPRPKKAAAPQRRQNNAAQYFDEW